MCIGQLIGFIFFTSLGLYGVISIMILDVKAEPRKIYFLEPIYRGSEMCNKRKFRTELDAKIALVSSYYKSHIKNNKRRKEIRYYWCDKCKAYHLTSKEDINATNRTDGVKSSRSTTHKDR